MKHPICESPVVYTYLITEGFEGCPRTEATVTLTYFSAEPPPDEGCDWDERTDFPRVTVRVELPPSTRGAPYRRERALVCRVSTDLYAYSPGGHGTDSCYIFHGTVASPTLSEAVSLARSKADDLCHQIRLHAQSRADRFAQRLASLAAAEQS